MITLYQISEMLHVCLHQWDSTAQQGNASKGTRERFSSVPAHNQLYLPLSFHQRFWFPQRKLLRRLFVYVLLSIEPQQQFPVQTKSSFSWFPDSPRCHRFTCGQFTTFLGKLKRFSRNSPLLTSGFLLFFKVPHLFMLPREHFKCAPTSNLCTS